jgi:uncharacterized membrane protein YeaQ/YmgE (transglycosylase-associated protein family)
VPGVKLSPSPRVYPWDLGQGFEKECHMLTTIIVTVILGAIIGALARLVLPGRQNISTLMTVVLGIVGALIGSWLWTGVFNKSNTSGIDWIALIMGVIVAAVLIVIYERVVAGRRTSTRV